MTRPGSPGREGGCPTGFIGWSMGDCRWSSASGMPAAERGMFQGRCLTPRGGTPASIERGGGCRHAVRPGAPWGPGQEQISHRDVRLSGWDGELGDDERLRCGGRLELLCLFLELGLGVGELLRRRLELLLRAPHVLTLLHRAAPASKCRPRPVEV